jgi:plasmid stabilization system protein ParE
VRVIWTEPALDAVLSAYDYIFEFNQRAAAQVAASLLDAGDGLAHFPLRGHSVAGTDMRELVSVRPYIIRYRVLGDEVIILRIRHASQRPTDP